jgi:hypothetical protein
MYQNLHLGYCPKNNLSVQYRQHVSQAAKHPAPFILWLSLGSKHHSVTAILTEQIEIFKPALAASFKFPMTVILPVMAHYFLPIAYWFLLWVIANESSESRVSPDGQNFVSGSYKNSFRV